MVEKIETARIVLWGNDVGAVSWLPDRHHSIFEFDPKFINSGLDISPLHMNGCFRVLPSCRSSIRSTCIN